jgi:predicted RNA-binding protein YlqC (UPF0109 family)
MQDLALHLMRPIAAHPDDIQLQVVEGEAAVILEAIVHPDDRETLEEDGGRTLRAIRNVLSAAAGRRKATLDLVDRFSPEGASEE